VSPAKVTEEALLEAVADTSRRRVLDLILSHGEATPTSLAAELPFTRQAVAKHLAVLDRAGLVESSRQGREVHYSVRPEHLDRAVRAMARVAARWDSRLDAIKRMAEAGAAARSKTARRAASQGTPRPIR
jgi:DNA-binding transcriptional ArsR family regulator